MAKTKTKTKSTHGGGIVEAAADAAQELGLAAVAFKESWKHIKKAQSKGKPATRAATRTARGVAKTTTRAVKRVLPGRRRGK